MAQRVLYVNPLALGGNPAIDAIAYGLQHTLHAAEIELRVLFADFTAPDYRRQYEDAIAAGIAARDETMLGTLEAIDEAKRGGEMKLVSRNGSPQAVAAIRAGRSHGTWDIDITEIGAAVGELVVRVLVKGEQLEGVLALAPLGRLITSENADSYRPWSERTLYAPLHEGLE